MYESVRLDLKKRSDFLRYGYRCPKISTCRTGIFGTLIPAHDNTFSALNSAVWSGGSFIYVPKNVKIDLPLQAYFRINAEQFGQFERTLIIADEGSFVHYTEGCTAPIYTRAFAPCGSRRNHREERCPCSIHDRTELEQVSTTSSLSERARGKRRHGMGGLQYRLRHHHRYPAIYLTGRGARGEMLSIALAGNDQVQDTGGKMIHLASDTTSRVVSKSISKGGGQSTYRGIVHIAPREECEIIRRL